MKKTSLFFGAICLSTQLFAVNPIPTDQDYPSSKEDIYKSLLESVLYYTSAESDKDILDDVKVEIINKAEAMNSDGKCPSRGNPEILSRSALVLKATYFYTLSGGNKITQDMYYVTPGLMSVKGLKTCAQILRS